MKNRRGPTFRNSMPALAAGLALTVSACLNIGCRPPETADPAVSLVDVEPAAVAESPAGDPSSIVATLQSTATAVKLDANGFVIDVDYRGATIGDETVEQLSRLTHLRYLKLAGTGITNTGLIEVGKIASLRSLDLRDCAISDAGIGHLVGLTQLKALRLSGKSGATDVGDAAMTDIAGLTQLKSLALDCLWVSDLGIASLAPLQNLEELYMAKTLIGDDALTVLSNFPLLRKLRVSDTQVSSAGLERLATLSALEDLDLSENSLIFDDGLPHLAAMTSLKRLNLWRVAVTDNGIANLAGLQQLEWLNLDNTRLTDAGLPHLAGLHHLTFLHLGSTAITDAGLTNLESLTTLRDLKVTRTAVTAAGVAQLKTQLPETEVQLEYIAGD